MNDDVEFIKAFQVMDGKIQNNEVTFVTSWLLSVLTVAASGILAWQTQLKTSDRITVPIAAILFMMGHVSTATQNIPLNNRIHNLDIDSADDYTISELRQEIEGPWQRWNTFRTIIFGFVSIYYLIVLVNMEKPKKVGSLDESLNYQDPGEVNSTTTPNFSRYV